MTVCGRAGVMAAATEVPPLFRAQEITAAFAVPEFLRTTTHESPEALHEVTCAVTVAELVNDPNRPKTNPAMAIAAMRVMAMRMTVARTGEMAILFLFFP